jgi:hypothetical protein
MFGLSDAECFLLGWAVGATIMAFNYREQAQLAKGLLKSMFFEKELRTKVFDEFDKFKAKHGL